jgi:hypothetical protein
MNLALVLSLLASLVGLPALISVVIDALKQYGVISDGNASQWSAGFNLFSLVAVLIVVNFFPTANVATIDGKLLEVAKLAGLILSYVAQIFVSKGVHVALSSIFPKLSFSKMLAKAAKIAAVG